MAEKINIITIEDFNTFKNEFLKEVKAIKDEVISTKFNFMRSREVMNELGVSSSHLQRMRIEGVIPYTKLGDTFYYPRLEIEKILQDNMKNIA